MKSKIFRIDDKSSNMHIIGYMMNSLKNNDIKLNDNKLISILYNIEMSSKIGKLFLVDAGDDLTLLIGYLNDKMFTIVFYENKWTEYFAYKHNYYSIIKFGNVNNPYLTFEAFLDYYDSIINHNESLKYNDFGTLVFRFNKMLEHDSERFGSIMDGCGHIQLGEMYNILMEYEIVKEEKEDK
nr:MAG TPA: hypothetical protein [Caudoviricetes sp.]